MLMTTIINASRQPKNFNNSRAKVTRCSSEPTIKYQEDLDCSADCGQHKMQSAHLSLSCLARGPSWKLLELMMAFYYYYKLKNLTIQIVGCALTLLSIELPRG